MHCQLSNWKIPPVLSIKLVSHGNTQEALKRELCTFEMHSYTAYLLMPCHNNSKFY